jgi:hypothetical protein
LYGTIDFDGAEALLAKLGKHPTCKGCLCIKKIADVHMNGFETLVERAVGSNESTYLVADPVAALCLIPLVLR